LKIGIEDALAVLQNGRRAAPLGAGRRLRGAADLLPLYARIGVVSIIFSTAMNRCPSPWTTDPCNPAQFILQDSFPCLESQPIFNIAHLWILRTTSPPELPPSWVQRPTSPLSVRPSPHHTTRSARQYRLSRARSRGPSPRRVSFVYSLPPFVDPASHPTHDDSTPTPRRRLTPAPTAPSSPQTARTPAGSRRPGATAAALRAPACLSGAPRR